MSGRHGDAIRPSRSDRRAADKARAAAEALRKTRLLQEVAANAGMSAPETAAEPFPATWTQPQQAPQPHPPWDEISHEVARFGGLPASPAPLYTPPLALTERGLRALATDRLHRIARVVRVPAATVIRPAEPAKIYDALHGDERTARACMHCGTADPRDDPRWREDALLKWSCPPCQALPGWRSPYPAVLAGEGAEWPLICAASVVARDRTPGRRHYLGAPWRAPVSGRAS